MATDAGAPGDHQPAGDRGGVSTPNVYADQIEWFCDHVANRDSLLISLPRITIAAARWLRAN